MPELIDGCGRRLEYLRVSVTDRCNLRCVYCLPAAGAAFAPPREVLSPGELERICRVGASLGLRKIRLTGGEPLVRADLPEIVERLSRLGLEDLSLTTNGILLAEKARLLRSAGLRRVNVSLDTLDPEKFRSVTRLGDIGRVWAGIEAALEAGLEPLKVNVVVARGMNDSEIPAFVELARARPLHVRFIELMPIGDTGFFGPSRWLPMPEIRAACGPLEPARAPLGFGPAEYLRPPGGRGTVGFIGAMSCGFCARCNRLRLTATGRLLPCLTSGEGADLRTPMRGGQPDATIEALFRLVAATKPKGHRMNDEAVRESFMCGLGG